MVVILQSSAQEFVGDVVDNPVLNPLEIEEHEQLACYLSDKGW